MNDFVKSVQRQIDDNCAPDPDIFSHGRQEVRAHRLECISAGNKRGDYETAGIVCIDAGNHAQIGAQKLDFSADLRLASRVAHHA